MKLRLIALLFSLSLVCAMPTFYIFAQSTGGQKDEQKKDEQTPAPQAQKLAVKLFEIKYRNPSSLANSLQSLGSGAENTRIFPNDDLKTLTVRDYPENIAVIEEAIKRLDTPLVRDEPSVDLSIRVLLTRTDAPSNLVPAPLPPDLNDVVKQMQNTFAFKDYQLVTTIVQRSKIIRAPGKTAVYGRGDALWIESYKREDGSLNNQTAHADYEYKVNGIVIATNPSGAAKIQLDSFSFKFGNALVQTDLDVRDGEKLVVGTASWGNKAMILVLTAKIIK
jgi:type II/III secretion system protein